MFPVHDRVGLSAIPDHDAAAIGADIARHPDTLDVDDDLDQFVGKPIGAVPVGAAYSHRGAGQAERIYFAVTLGC